MKKETGTAIVKSMPFNELNSFVTLFKVCLFALLLLGKRSIEIIVGCACVTPFCYRVSAFEAFPEEHTDVRGEKVIRTKVCERNAMSADVLRGY